MVHLEPLPGAPGYQGSMSDIVDRARSDAQLLAEAGFEGIMVENFGDAPFYADDAPKAEQMLKYDVHACTDVTGFGLLGHLKEMSAGSACDVSIYFDKIPFLREVKNLATAGIVPGGTFNNLDFVAPLVDFGKHPRTNQLLLSDAQTSGGLLVAMPAADAISYLKDLHQNGFSDACVIGEFTENGRGGIRVL